MALFYPYSPPRRDDTWRTRRDGAVSLAVSPWPERHRVLESSSSHEPGPARPTLDPSPPIAVESDVVYIEPSMSPGFVWLIAYRADGRPFIRMELPEEAVKAWATPLERYTASHDVTRHPKFLELLR